MEKIPKTNHDKVKELSDKIKEGVKDFYQSDTWKKYLTMVSKFHTYSYRNTMLILRENPNATRVAGYNKWKELGRQVRRGEAGIPIIVPKGIQKWKAEIPKQNEFGQPVKNADGSVQLEEVEMESIQFGVTVNEKDKLLVLSTCSYEYDNFRTVVVARKVRKGESVKVDTQNAVYRSSPLYPDCWYGDSEKPQYPETFQIAQKQHMTEWYDGKLLD